MNSPTDTDTFKKLQEQREQQVIEHLAACERIRKRLELPIEALALIDRSLRGDPEFGKLPTPRSPVEPPRMLSRSPLRLLSEKKIRPTDPITGKPTPVHVRPQTIAMRVEEIEILSDPAHWMIADVQVGNRSQFPQAGPPLPGRLFTLGGTCHHFVTETIQTAMDFTLLVHYVGPEAEGGIFEAVAMGSAAYQADRMLIANKNGRKIRAMVMDTPVNQCRGVVQCALPGCEAYMAIVDPGTQRDSGNVEDASPTEQVEWFLEYHECHAPGRRSESPVAPPRARVAGRHGRRQ